VGVITAPDTETKVAAAVGRPALREALGIGVAVALANLLLLVRVHNEAEDSIGYLVHIRSGSPDQLFNPYHLIHSWLGWLAFRASALAGYDGGPLVPVQAMNALIGAAGIAMLWILVRHATIGRLPSIAAVGLVALSYGYWSYSQGADVYVLSAALLIAALFAGYRAALNPTVRAFALFGLLTGVAVLGHNTNILFGATGVAAIFFATRDARAMMRLAFAYGAGVLVAVVPLYIVALAVAGATTPAKANDWLTAYAQSGTWGNVDAQSAPKAVVGAGRALVGGHFAFALGGVRDLADRASGDQSLREETYLSRDYPEPLAIALLGLVAIAGVSMAMLALRWLRRPALDRRARTLAVLSIAWLVTYSVFVTWWEPVNPEFWIAIWVPAAILLALPLADAPGTAAKVAVAALLPPLLIVNLAGSILPQRFERNDYWRQRVEWYESNVRDDDLVVSNGFLESAYLRYFAHARVLDIDLYADEDVDTALTGIDEAIASSNARRVLFSSEVFRPASDAYSTCDPGAKPCLPIAAAVRDRYELRARLIASSPLEQVWQLSP
jgi:hypothetical protein